MTSGPCFGRPSSRVRSLLTVLAFQVVVTFFMYFAPTPGAAGVAEGGYGLLFAQLVRKQDITPLMNSSGADFMISLGNAVYDGAEGKYRLLYRGLKKLDIPYLMAVGHNEVEDFGAGEFYGHFGPYFFSFHVENAYFIFLDSTGLTSWEWQMRWLRQEMTAVNQFPYRFVFLNHSVFSLPGFDPHDTHYVLDGKLSRELRQLFSSYRVTAVFSAGYPTYHERVEQGVRYIIQWRANFFASGSIQRPTVFWAIACVKTLGAWQITRCWRCLPHIPMITIL